MTNKQIMYIQFTQSILFWFSYATLEGLSGYILYISYMKRKSFSSQHSKMFWWRKKIEKKKVNCHNFCFIFQVRKTSDVSELIKTVIQNSINYFQTIFSISFGSIYFQGLFYIQIGVCLSFVLFIWNQRWTTWLGNISILPLLVPFFSVELII